MNKELLSQLQTLAEKKYDGNIETMMRELGRDLAAQAHPRAKKKRKGAAHKNAETIIRLEGVSKEYKMGKEKVHALKNVDVDIVEGEIVALIGPSGSGKSTMLQLMGALDKPTRGTVIVNKENIQELSSRASARYRNKTIGFIFQFFHLQPYLTVQNNVEIPLMFRGVDRKTREKSSKAALEAVGLGDRMKHRPSQLSGGQMQRVAIARALVNDPRIILADEPTGNLDRKNAAEVMEVLTNINEERKTTMIIVTHDHFIAGFADRVIELSDGEVKA